MNQYPINNDLQIFFFKPQRRSQDLEKSKMDIFYLFTIFAKLSILGIHRESCLPLWTPSFPATKIRK